MRDSRSGRVLLTASTLVFVVGAALFLWISHRATTDIQLHAEFIVDCIESRFFPVDALYYLTVAALGLFRTDPGTILLASSLVLGVALAAKFHVSVRCATRWLGLAPDGHDAAQRWLLLSCAGLALLFCLPLPGQHWYLGQFPPNQWHNSTNIAVMPFAVLLFFYATRFLESGHARWIFPVALMTILNLLTKPSLFFSFALVFPVYTLLRHGPRRRFLLSCVPVAAGGVLMLLYYLFVFHNPVYRQLMGAGDVRLAFGFMQPWGAYSANIPLSILNSLLLPLLVYVVHPRFYRDETAVRFASGLLAVGLVIFTFVHETGDRALHGNLSWQNITANYLLHLALLVAYARHKLRVPGIERSDYVIVGVFVFEALVGVAYIVRLVVTGNYI